MGKAMSAKVKKTTKKPRNVNLDLSTSQKLNFNLGHKGKKWNWSIKFGVSFVTFITIIGIILLQAGIFGQGKLGKTLQLTLIALGDKSSQIANSITSSSDTTQVQNSSMELATLSKDISELNLNDTKGLSEQLKKTLILTIEDYRQYTSDLSLVTSHYPDLEPGEIMTLINLATKIKLNLSILQANKLDIKVDEKIFKIPDELLEIIKSRQMEPSSSSEIDANPSIASFLDQELKKCRDNISNCPQGIDQITSYTIGEISRIDEYYKVVVSIVKENKAPKQSAFYIRLIQDQFQIIAVES